MEKGAEEGNENDLWFHCALRYKLMGFDWENFCLNKG